MGNMCSSGGGAASPPAHTLTALEKLTASKVKEYITKNRVQASKSLNQIIMKFPSILKAFEEIRVIFEQIDTDKNGSIEKDEFTAACDRMKVGVDSETVNKIYEEADIDKNGHVDYKEFILMITVLYLMSANSLSAEDDSATIVNNAIRKVLEAFLFFDTDGDGYIEKAEVTQIMREGVKEGGGGGSAKGGKKSVVSAERFEEMDWDQSGRVTFKEFLFAVEGWVGLEEDEE